MRDVICPLEFRAYQGDRTYALPDGYEELGGMTIPKGIDPTSYIVERVREIDYQKEQQRNQSIEALIALTSEHGSFIVGVGEDNCLTAPTRESFDPRCPIVIDQKTSLTTQDIPVVIQQVPGISVARKCDVSKQGPIKSPAGTNLIPAEEFIFQA